MTRRSWCHDDNDDQDQEEEKNKREAIVAATMYWFLFSLLFTLVASGQNQGYRQKNFSTPSWLPSRLPLPVEETSREGDGILICKGKGTRRRGSKKCICGHSNGNLFPIQKPNATIFFAPFIRGVRREGGGNLKGLTELSAWRQGALTLKQLANGCWSLNCRLSLSRKLLA